MGTKFKIILLLSLTITSCGDDQTTSLAPVEKSDTPTTLVVNNNSPVESIEDEQVVSIPNELLAMYNSANEEYVVYGGGPEEGVANLIVEYSLDENLPYENLARGYCDRTGSTPRIILYKHDWVPMISRDITRNYYQRKRSFYHLIGHCIFNLPHNDETVRVRFGNVDFNYPDSIMHSNWVGGMVPRDVRGYWVQNCINKLWREIKSLRFLK